MGEASATPASVAPATEPERLGPVALALVVIAVVLGGALRVADLDGTPPGFYMDEASTGYDAFAILHTGRDQHGALLPLFAQSLGDWNEASLRYVVVPFVALLGNTEVAVRPLGRLTATGVELSVEVPSPSWPWPFHPQQ